MNDKKIIVALDNNKIKNIVKIINDLRDHAFAFKLGYEFFFNYGIEGYKIIKKEKIKIFLDLKLNDIPNTVGKGIEAIEKLKPYFTTIHINGGDDMQKKANLFKNNIKILGVSILTSLDTYQTKKYFFNKNINNIISKFAKYALENKLDGIVCSPKEIKIIKKITNKNMLIITPGIRPANYKDFNDDQKRTMTPREAIDAGANYLVIGRPITSSQNPIKEIKSINKSLE